MTVMKLVFGSYLTHNQSSMFAVIDHDQNHVTIRILSTKKADDLKLC